MTNKILHLTKCETWQSAVEKNRYEPESLLREGFIHCSKTSQILEVANAFYRGERGLVLLVIDPDQLASELKWEPPAELLPNHAQDGELFPHIYGSLNLEAVVKSVSFEPDEDGLFNSLPNL
jgi:uncharacterized protein (DUF952 family)